MIDDINISNKLDLERAFAEDFSSPIFPILGELYLKNKDFQRAEKVCRIGLKHDPNNINGYYILAKVYLYNNSLNKAEKQLIELLNKKPLHINALKLIVKVQEELGASNKNKLKYLKKLFNIFPDDKNIESKIAKIDTEPINQKQSLIDSKQVNIEASSILTNKFNIQPSMATLTFVEILKEQKHYEEALHVLSLLESKSKTNTKIKKIKNELKQLLAELH